MGKNNGDERVIAHRWLTGHTHARRSTRRGASSNTLAKRITATTDRVVSGAAVVAAATALGYAMVPPKQGGPGTMLIALGMHQCSPTCRVFLLGDACVVLCKDSTGASVGSPTPARDRWGGWPQSSGRRSPEDWEGAGLRHG